jgi:AcrR family transcriptional regulator
MPDPAVATSQRRRADAERSVAAILDAALDELARDPDASMSAIARRAGVVRATVYVHFPTRESLIEAVTDRAIGEVMKLIEAAEPTKGDPAEALVRTVRAAWRGLGRYHALVAINVRLPPHELRARHDPVFGTIEPLIVRGQRTGTFRRGVPPAWHLSMIMALIHAASDELRSGRMSEQEIEPALIATMLGALASA